MSASPSLSHSPQDKEFYQKMIKDYEEVSDECSSGVMRVVHVAVGGACSSGVMRVVHVDHFIPGVCSM